MAQTAAFPLSMTKATAVPSNVPIRHIQAERESSAGYVLSVIDYKSIPNGLVMIRTIDYQPLNHTDSMQI